MSNGFVIAMGIGTVFSGLICIIIICEIMGAFCKKLIKTVPDTKTESETTTMDIIPNKQEFVAAVSAVLAEEMGTDVSGIRIHSIKKI